ncbi:MAG TPA: hypothetical protein VMU20_00850, partial [Candidatus Dormibacteraeota bacterium]|nr:hypothetical protein [Candidatus Dormibacteraeota bacterium]
MRSTLGGAPASSGRMSRRILVALSRVTGCPLSDAWASTRISAPSSSRMFFWILWAMKEQTSSGTSRELGPSLLLRIA